jgi:hypothetical protein
MMKKINATEYYEIIGNEIRVLDGDGVTSRILPATPALVADLEHHAVLFAEADQAEQQRAEQLAQPLSPLPIEGSTVAEVKASADIAIADLAAQMQAKIDAILGGTI